MLDSAHVQYTWPRGVGYEPPGTPRPRHTSVASARRRRPSASSESTASDVTDPDSDDDEVAPIDRGTALVRKRMRERRRRAGTERGSVSVERGERPTQQRQLSVSERPEKIRQVSSGSIPRDSTRSQSLHARAEAPHLAVTADDSEFEHSSDDGGRDALSFSSSPPPSDSISVGGGGSAIVIPSDNESEDVEYTLKDRQDAINIEHPFGLPIWKSALYKKNRSVTQYAEIALHATPSSTVLKHLDPVNIIWTLCFGIWFFVVCAIVSFVLWGIPWGGQKYGRVIWELGTYLVWPFGKYVEGHQNMLKPGTGGVITEEASEIQGEAASEAPPTEDVPAPDKGKQRAETTPLARSVGPSYGSSSETLKGPVSTSEDASPSSTVTDVDGSEFYNVNGVYEPRRGPRLRALGRVMYWISFYGIIAPLMLAACVVCWGLVFTVPMAKLLWVLLRYLNDEPLALHFRSPRRHNPSDTLLDSNYHETTTSAHKYPLRAGQPAPSVSRQSLAQDVANGRFVGPHRTILLCTYHAAGLKYYKYTIDGVNIIFINLLSLVFFAIADFWIFAPFLNGHGVGGVGGIIASNSFIFVIALMSVIPLSYFIGMAVASISAQSSIGMGAVINATFGSIIEIILYSIALTQGKGALVEGSIIGSILAGVLLMPGLSMIAGGLKRKEQRFNAKSAGVTSTMLIMAIIGIMTPTMFYEIYGSFELQCSDCDGKAPGVGAAHTGVSYPLQSVVQMVSIAGASTMRGLLGVSVPKADAMGTSETAPVSLLTAIVANATPPLTTFPDETCRKCYYEHVDPSTDPFYLHTVKYLSYYCATLLVLSYLIGLWFSLRTHASQIWQNAAPPPGPVDFVPAPADRRVAPRKSTHFRAAGSQAASSPHRMRAGGSQAAGSPHRAPANSPHPLSLSRSFSHSRGPFAAASILEEAPPHAEGGGHDAPNWSRTKSASVLFGCTALYAVIAEILVDVVDVVLEGSGIPEKLLGITLFALVPNTTEFMNAISFALSGNISLSVEIGSAYALQVCLLQIPAMLAFSAYYSIVREKAGLSLVHRTFTLVFPRWDTVTILFSIFLLTYVYIEARSNYYRGAILVLSYLVLVGGFATPTGRSTEGDF